MDRSPPLLSVPAPDEIVDPGAGRGPAWLDELLTDRLADLVAVRRRVHRHPELGRRESATTALIVRTLTEVGIPVRVLPGGTGAVADIGTHGPIIGLRADIDALPMREATGLPYSSTIPDLAHMCGHDAHLTVLLGAALALHRAPSLPGRVRLIFQPAEEVFPGGSHDVIAAGMLDGVEKLFALHCDPRLPVGQVGLKVGAITSTSDVVEVRITGPGGHTSRPHLTTDLVYALGMLITGLPALLTRRMDPRSAAVMVWGSVHAGQAPNAIPQDGVVRGTLRLMNRAAWDSAERIVRELVGELLAPTRAEYELTYSRGVPPVDNDLVCSTVQRIAVEQGLGADRVAVAEQSTGAEDFAVYLDHVPGSLARLGVWDGVGRQVDLHSPQFVLDERALAVGIRLMTHTALAAFQA
ncbi:amidohydrolase [Nakamurella flavida]|uniref:amidohydrolase n=1 Tax=Nakamurella flavida TaxID=363630 RepID=UPI001F052844|nr:amidohydrolase [Nakamurella flavida]MDP9777711.1 amidohydrolase [Nakamurella flavida]